MLGEFSMKAGEKAFKGIHTKAEIKVPKRKRKAYRKILKKKMKISCEVCYTKKNG